MAKYHPPKKKNLKLLKERVQRQAGPLIKFSKKRKAVVLIAVFITIISCIGIVMWLTSPEAEKPVATQSTVDKNPFDNLPGAKDKEEGLKESGLTGKDQKLSELSIGFNYLYEKNYPKAEEFGRKYVEDPEQQIKSQAQCLLALVYQMGGVQSLKPYEAICNEQ